MTETKPYFEELEPEDNINTIVGWDSSSDFVVAARSDSLGDATAIAHAKLKKHENTALLELRFPSVEGSSPCEYLEKCNNIDALKKIAIEAVKVVVEVDGFKDHERIINNELLWS